MGWSEHLHRPGSPYHLVRCGARLGPLTNLCAAALPLSLCISPDVRRLCFTNGSLQLVLFLLVVQLPALKTSRMSYVDIGWPCGLVVLGVVGAIAGEGYFWRRMLIGSLMTLHGGRMAIGALMLFFPYSFKEDLPRYRYAKVRFEAQDGMPPSLWWLKIQHDTLQQCYANIAVLAAPVLLLASDGTPGLRYTELAAALLWAASQAFENAADAQMLWFQRQCPKELRHTAVLGRAPHNSWIYCCWTRCRHPNYFGEWMCWNAFALMAVPTALTEPNLLTRLGLCLTLLLVSRLFYDCLVYWTGAEPAEYFSVRKRAEYREHQKTTRVFFPFEMPWVDHHRTAGWPTPGEFSQH